MSIVITNLGGDLQGVCTYQVKINQQVITEFKHDRRKGLGICLLEASKAVERAKWQGAAEILGVILDRSQYG